MKKIIFLAIFTIIGLTAAILNTHEIYAMAGALTIAMALPAGMTQEQAEEIALEYLQGYEGDQEYSGYDGGEDESLSFFGQANSFRNEIDNGVQFAFTLTNHTATTHTIALYPAYYNRYGYSSGFVKNSISEITGGGHAEVTAVLTDGTLSGTGTALLTATANRGKIEDFLNFVKFNPTRITEITVAANGVNAYEKDFIIKKVTPFRTFGEDRIHMTNYFSPDQYQSGKIIIPTTNMNLQLDDQTLLLFEMQDTNGSGTDATAIITFKIGAIKNAAGELFSQAKRAHTNIAQAGGAVKFQKAGLRPAGLTAQLPSRFARR